MFWTWIDRPYDIPAFDLMMLISERLFGVLPKRAAGSVIATLA